MLDLNSLNDKQKEAVLETNSKIMVIAGAGSGKTKVLTSRVAYLIENGCPSERMLALTFTNKASNEMKERIEKITGVNSKQINAMTFHSFAVKVLRKHIQELNLGYNKNFIILDAEDTKKMFKAILKEHQMEVDDFQSFLDNYNNYIYKNMRCPIILTRVYDDFNKEAKKNNLLTFDDLQFLLYECFKNNEILNEYSKKFIYVLADEYQDTEPLQYELLQMLSSYYGNLFVVGDDAQAIYSFRGASSEVIQQFLKDYPDAKLIKFEQNYRSTPEILNMANEVIKNNFNQIPKTLFTGNKHGFIPSLEQNYDYKEETKSITRKIEELHHEGITYKDIAVLYRTNSISRTIEQGLIDMKIPYIICGGTGFFAREEIKDLIAYIRVIANDYDNLALKRIISKPRRKIGDKALAEIEALAKKNESEEHYSILNALQNYKSSQAQKFYQDILNIREKYYHGEISLSKIVDEIMFNLNYEEYFRTLEDTKTNDRDANIEELISLLTEAERNDDFESKPNTQDFLTEFLQKIALYTDVEAKENADAIKLMTIHASKGLEFKVVILPALEEDIIPHRNCELPEEIEEERRLFYVAITRAREQLYLYSSCQRMLNGILSYNAPSRFLKEAKQTLIKKY